MGMPVADQRDFAAPPATPAGDTSETQLSFDSLDSLDEPAEVLVRISNESLAGLPDLPAEDEPADGFAGQPDDFPEADMTAEAGEGAEVEDTEAAEGSAAYEDAEVQIEKSEAVAGSEPEAPAENLDEGQAESGADLAYEAAAPAIEIQPPAFPLPYEPSPAPPGDDPSLQIRLARIHLKTGSLAMARAELEALAGRDRLDAPARLDLAEARWRTGDLEGAGEAAAAYLADGGDEALGFLIAAEAAALANRHAESRRFVDQALERQLSGMDPLFAGMPRRAAWASQTWSPPAVEIAVAEPAPAEAGAGAAVPSEPAAEAVAEAAPEAAPEPAPVEPEVAPVEPEVAAVEPEAPEAEPEVAPVEPEPAQVEPEAAAEAAPAEPEAVESIAAETPSEEVSEEAPEEEQTLDAVEANAEVVSGRSYLDAGDALMAALHFGVALRLTPASAGAVLEAIGERQDLPLQLVRGDALRLLGLEGDAGKAYLSVASALGAPKPVAPAPSEPEAQAESAPLEPPASPEPESASAPTEPAAASSESEPLPPAPPESAAESAEPEPPAAAVPPEPAAAPSEPEPPAAPAVEEAPPIRWD